MSLSVGDLLAKVPKGQSRSFKSNTPGESNDRFVEVAYNWNYGSVLTWGNRPPMEEAPWMGSRSKPRIGLDGMLEPELAFDREAGELVDFYMPSPSVHVISDRLLALINRIDPDSLEVRPVVVKTRGGQARLNMVMPRRLLEAVDAERCDVDIVAKKLDTIWVARVNFPRGAVFDPQLASDIHNFADLDMGSRWFWSSELVNTAKQAGIKGLYTKKPGGLASEQIDEL